jgi:hypothetical protein
MNKVLIAGSVDWDDWPSIEDLLRRYDPTETVILVPNTRGVGKMARHKAQNMGFTTWTFNTDWDHGRRAPHIRDVAMLDMDPDIVHVLRFVEDPRLDEFESLVRKAGLRPLTESFDTPSKKEAPLMDAQLLEQLTAQLDPETLAKVIENVVEQKATAKAQNYESPGDKFSETQVDVEGKPLKLEGTGVRHVQRLATCKRCGSGNVAWVKSRSSVYPDVYRPGHPKEGQAHPKAGQPTDYLAQAYTEGNKVIALAFQLHSNYCDPTGAAVKENPVPAQASIDDLVEKDRSEPKPFDGFHSAEVNEVGDDPGMGIISLESLESELSNDEEEEA